MFEIQQAAQCGCIGMEEQERGEGGEVREITEGLKRSGWKAIEKNKSSEIINAKNQRAQLRLKNFRAHQPPGWRYFL